MATDDIESQHVGVQHGASIDMEHDSRRRMLINSLKGMFETLVPPLTSECCIYRVPGSLRKLNEAAYIPRVISIGPFHRGKDQVKVMEKHKERYLYDFLLRAKVSLEDLITSIKEWEERVRRCYAETIELSSDEFTKMILLDAGFIIGYILKCCDSKVADENDIVMYNPRLDYDIQHDLILLENQLPFFALEQLYNLVFSIDPNDQTSSFLKLACLYFSDFNNQFVHTQGLMIVKHFTDLVRTFQLPFTPKAQPKKRGNRRFSYSATELNEGGVKFKGNSSKCMFDIKFTEGVLRIPCFHFEENTESLIRNLMALEQCHYPGKTYICEYIILMVSLANTAKDVELLVRHGIIYNGLGSNDVLATLFNNLCIEIKPYVEDSYFYPLCEDMTEYYENHWKRWKATLKRDYLNTPWPIGSTIAAVTLLVLTLIQTVNSFIPLWQ